MIRLIPLLALPLATTLASQPRPAAADPVRFVVLGHIRGDQKGLNPRLAETLERVRALEPRFVVLTGDIIWGDVQNRIADSATVEREWTAIDSALATLGVPIYRVPGNHDISDLPSRDIWYRRYGRLPNKVVVGDLRLLLLSSAWIPQDGDTLHNPHIRGVDLDSAQVRWLAAELAAPERYRQTLVFMHHLLWWQPPEGRWWREVHPLLASGGVGAVFTGDYGPLKFSTTERDRVRYYQSSIETPVALTILRNRIPSRVLSAQFDCFLEVVGGSQLEVRVHPVAEVSSGEFTPDRHRAINAVLPQPKVSRLAELVGSPRRMGLVAVATLGLLGLGFLVGRRTGRRPS
jgi:hypothetical protein